MRLRSLFAAALFALSLAGCKSAQSVGTHGVGPEGVPNLYVVGGAAGAREAERLIYRGGQPTAEGWTYLHETLHVNTVVKLNAPEESAQQGWDEPAQKLGMAVVRISIPPHDYGLVPVSAVEPFRAIPEEKIAEAVAAMADARNGNVYVHCTHGRDRTGLIVGLYRVFEQGWEAKRAYEEMNQAGFRPINHNLHDFWEELFEHPENAEAAERRSRLAKRIRQARGPDAGAD